jgi:multidrug transporter EmrE-like cation transporter
MNTIIFIAVYLFCSTIGLMLLKTSLVGRELNSVSAYIGLILNYKFIVGFSLYAASFLAWLFLLSRKDLSFIYPIVVGLSYVLIILMAVVILKENFTLNKALGAFLIGAGIIIIFAQK